LRELQIGHKLIQTELIYDIKLTEKKDYKYLAGKAKILQIGTQEIDIACDMFGEKVLAEIKTGDKFNEKQAIRYLSAIKYNNFDKMIIYYETTEEKVKEFEKKLKNSIELPSNLKDIDIKFTNISEFLDDYEFY
jgi:hypothetical protein